MGLSDSPLCRKCGAEEQTSADVLCGCEALTTHRHTYLDSFFLDPEYVRELSLGGDLDLYYKDRALMTWTLAKGHKGPVKGLRASVLQGPDPLFTHYSLLTLAGT
jgi:hypothetical protein